MTPFAAAALLLAFAAHAEAAVEPPRAEFDWNGHAVETLLERLRSSEHAAAPSEASLPAPAGAAVRLIGDAGWAVVDADGFVSRGTRKWAGGVLPVVFASSVTAQRQAAFFEACRHWERVANVRCAPRTRHSNFLRVGGGDGCSSTVGRRGDRMTLAAGCWGERILVHEIGHAFGLSHEHQRPDRDDYILVLPDNIQPGRSPHFERLRGDTGRQPYDFESVMHYAQGDFAKDGLKSFVGKPGYEAAAAAAGASAFPSAGDAAALSRLYGRPRER